MAAWGGDVRGASRARWAREWVRGSGRGRRSRDGPALGPHAPAPAHAPARGPSAHRPPSLEPRRGRPLLRAKRRHDVLLARLRRSRISTCLPLWFVFYFIPLWRIFIFQNNSFFQCVSIFRPPPRLCFAYLVLCAFLSSFFKIPSIFSIVQLKLYVKYKVKFKCVFPYCTFVRVVLFCF